MIGGLALLLLAAFSVYQLTSHGAATTGVPAGKRLPLFVAPLAIGGPNLDANVIPRCDPAHPNPRGLNVCGHTPLVLALFVASSHVCTRQIDTLQTVAEEFPGSGVQFAAVAIGASQAQTAALVRARHWSIPVAFDRDGAIGSLYGVSVCPMIELAGRGGLVEQRLIGYHWLSRAALAARVRVLIGGAR
jgi:hypothetical protein